ncbi:MAG TPA: DUF4147 domain-containing protein [Spirochaetales bacterium]|nr:DUF4147 domain-containing protein [Spirochaetales bacterium]HQK33237.1 DUF4147 domain-containing protein [Spirochaetales bacterium]
MEPQKRREQAVAIIEAAVQHAKPSNLIQQCLYVQNGKLCVSTEQLTKNFDLSRYQRLLVTGFGKASATSASVIESLLGDYVSGGLIAVNKPNAVPLKKIQSVYGSHPIPDLSSINASKALLNFARQCTEDTLVINLISGGGSSILCAPYTDAMHHITLEEKAYITKKLLSCGASIKEINAVRKHLSMIKGGNLAKVFYPAEVLSLIISDVIGDDISTIASGPTAPDPTTWVDAFGILQKYELIPETPQSIIRLFHHGLRNLVPDTPKEGDIIFSKNTNLIIGSNRLACTYAIETAKLLGYRTLYLGSRIAGDVHKEARAFWRIVLQYAKQAAHSSQPICIIAGGEPTVEVAGTGKGGRAQEFALTFLNEMASAPNEIISKITLLTAATDGIDGITDAAGAFADSRTIESMKQIGLEPVQFIKHNDSYSFFKNCNSIYVSGATGTNVNDIYLALIG